MKLLRIILGFAFVSTSHAFSIVDFFEKNPPGHLVGSGVKRLSNLNVENIVGHAQFLRLLTQIVQAGNQGVVPEIANWGNQSYLTELCDDSRKILANCKTCQHQWNKKNRIAGFSSSLSRHSTAAGFDLHALGKVLPYGPGILTTGKMEMGRHAPDSNPAVKIANWGAFLSTALKIPAHKLNSTNLRSLLSSSIEHQQEFGLYHVGEDLLRELAEVSRNFYWANKLFHHGEYSMAYDSGVKWLGDVHSASRRLKKFIFLLPHGQSKLMAFQNTLAIPLFILDFREGYLDQIQARYESLQEKEFASGDYYAEMTGLGFKVAEPVIVLLHFLVHRGHKSPQDAWREGYTHQALNGAQYLTGAFVTSWGASQAISSHVTDHPLAPMVPFAALLAIYARYLGKPALASFKTACPKILIVLLIEDMASHMIGSARGDEHFSLKGEAIKYVKAYIELDDSAGAEL